MKKRIQKYLVAVILGGAWSTSFWSMNTLAQEGELTVRVFDAANGRSISDAVVVTNARDGETYETTTDTTGRAEFSELKRGLYEVLVKRSGYESIREPSIRIFTDRNTALNIEMRAAKQRLEEVVVVGDTRSGEQLSSAGSSSLNREALRSAAGSGSDILRALDGLPGLFSSGEFANFTVRGNGPRDNLILVDGIPFDNVVHFDDAFGEQEDIEGGGRYSVFAPNLISEAEFQPGGWNSAYGGRSGSLLKLSVAEGNPETPAYTVRLDVAGVELGYDGPSGLLDNTSILFSARSYDFGRFFEMIGLEDVGSPVSTDVIFKTSTELDDNNKLNMLFIYAPEEDERDIDNVLASDEDDPGNFEDVELSKSEVDNSLVALTWSRLSGESAQWTNQLYYRIFNEESSSGEAFPDLVPRDTPADEVPIRDNILVGQRDETEYGLRSDFSVDNSLGRLSAGLRVTRQDLDFSLALNGDWIRYIYDQDDQRGDEDQRFIRLTPESVDNTFATSATNYAIYTDQTFQFDRWDFRGGLRYDHDGFSEENLISPRLGALWQFNERLQLSATAGVYYQSPRFNDRAADSENAGLENEKITQASLGLRYNITPNWQAFIEPYYQQMDNLVTEGDGVEGLFDNFGDGRSFGFDSALSRRFGNGWSLNMNYSYNDARISDAKGLAYYDADFNRTHSASIGGIWEINDRWKISSRWKWASGTPRDSFVINEDVLGDGQPLRFSKEITGTNTERYDSFSSLNIRADYIRTIGSVNLITFIDVINVYGADNPSSSEFNERTGQDIIEEGEVLPLAGFRLEW